MSSFKTVRLKPNPPGKDRTRSGTSQTQLGAEWVDLQNVSSSSIKLDGVELYHIAYAPDGSGRWDKIMGFQGVLQANQIIRVHSGSGPESALRQEDLAGAQIHLFSGRNYVWNNDRGDCSALWQSGESAPFDKACYDPNPPEGVVLVRLNDKLVVPTSTPTYAYR